MWTPRPVQGMLAILGDMVRVSRTYGWLGLLLCIASGVAPAPVAGQASPERITTDTPQYCLRLLDRVSEAMHSLTAPPPEDVTSLSTEGQRMCNQGQTRGGILRLRRALVLLRDGSDP